jgi:hypothetical protein
VPYIEVKNPSATIEHEATTSKISDDQLFYAMQRGLDQEQAVALIVNGFAKEVLQQLPMEFAVEAQKLLGISLKAAWDDRVDRHGPGDRDRARQRPGAGGGQGVRQAGDARHGHRRATAARSSPPPSMPSSARSRRNAPRCSMRRFPAPPVALPPRPTPWPRSTPGRRSWTT